MIYRVGIVGSGFGGRVHAPAFTLHPKFEVVAIASPHNAAAVAAERKIPHAFSSVEEMLAAAGSEIDVVAVASPPYDHVRSVLAAVAAGKHVLCEKPLGINLAAVEEMAAAIERAGVVAGVAFEYRYGSAELALKELVDNGHLPQLREIEVTRFGTEMQSAFQRPPSSWWFDRQRGGGLANAFMPHIIDLALWLAHRTPRSAMGFLRTANPERTAPDGSAYASTVSDGCFALADLGDGIAARMTVDGTVSMNQCTIALHAEERTAVASGKVLTDMDLYVLDGDDTSEYELQSNPYEKYKPVYFAMPQFLSLLDDFAERIATGGGTCPTIADGVAVQRVLSAIGYEI